MVKQLCLFDVDGTLTKPRQVIDKSTLLFLLEKLRDVSSIGLVGGSDHSKIEEQIGSAEILNKFDYVFSENGLIASNKGELIGKQSLLDYLGEDKIQDVINFCLEYMSKLKLPRKRGTFIEFRTGMINVCPIGRSCSQAERDEFAAFDEENGIRIAFVKALEEKFPKTQYPLTYAIGGQISIDIFPTGWDKTYCLKFLDEFSLIHFFGDKTEKGGNDHEIFMHQRTIGHKVKGPEDTVIQLKDLFKL